MQPCGLARTEVSVLHRSMVSAQQHVRAQDVSHVLVRHEKVGVISLLSETK